MDIYHGLFQWSNHGLLTRIWNPRPNCLNSSNSSKFAIDDNLACEKQSKPISVAIFNGAEDPVNPYHEGYVILSGESVFYDWKKWNNPVWWGRWKFWHHKWNGSQGIQIRLYTLQGSGHVIPSKKVHFGRIFGGNAGDIESADEIWKFFTEISTLKH